MLSVSVWRYATCVLMPEAASVESSGAGGSYRQLRITQTWLLGTEQSPLEEQQLSALDSWAVSPVPSLFLRGTFL